LSVFFFHFLELMWTECIEKGQGQDFGLSQSDSQWVPVSQSKWWIGECHCWSHLLSSHSRKLKVRSSLSIQQI